jgi:Cu(I)/Ag(I) efflux system membrane fusion protein
LNTPSRVAATLSLAVLLGGGGYWAGTNNLGSALGLPGMEAALAAPRPEQVATGAVIYYRHPDGVPQFSATAKNTDDGRPFVAVKESEDVSFSAAAAKPAEKATVAAETEAAKGKILYYRNPMGLADTSKVPKKDSMGMDYIPVFAGEQSDPSTVKVSLGKLQRTGVKTTTAAMATIARQIRVPGTVTLDERLVSIISMRTDAFVDDVANVTTGDRIKKGEDLFRFYSKEIATAGAEYAGDKGDVRSDTGTALRLRNLGVSPETIRAIAQTHQVPTSISYPAPRDGVILERMATTGMMAKPGDVLFRIADISNVWVIADVPEFDLASVRSGAEVTVSVRSLPGKTFKGIVDLIYPQVQEQTRTTKVRIELPNPDGLLLANMYAEVEIDAGAPSPVVSVPNSAVIDTGDRQVVILDKGDGKFEPKDVKLGVRGEDQTEITKGIDAGDHVVVSANFLLDAESNLNSALSGMTTDEVKP